MDQRWSADRQGQGLWCQTFDADQKFFCTFLALLNNEMDFSNSSSIANLRWILIGAILLIKKSCFWVEEVESWRLSSFSRVGSFLFVALLLHINIPLMMPVVSTQCRILTSLLHRQINASVCWSNQAVIDLLWPEQSYQIDHHSKYWNRSCEIHNDSRTSLPFQQLRLIPRTKNFHKISLTYHQ